MSKISLIDFKARKSYGDRMMEEGARRFHLATGVLLRPPTAEEEAANGWNDVNGVDLVGVMPDGNIHLIDAKGYEGYYFIQCQCKDYMPDKTKGLISLPQPNRNPSHTTHVLIYHDYLKEQNIDYRYMTVEEYKEKCFLPGGLDTLIEYCNKFVGLVHDMNGFLDRKNEFQLFSSKLIKPAYGIIESAYTDSIRFGVKKTYIKR